MKKLIRLLGVDMKKWFDAIKFVVSFVCLSYLAGAFFTKGAMAALGMGW